jgi:flagellar hook-basal body complex protein FliE
VSELRIKPFDFQAAVARAGLRLDGLPGTAGALGTGRVAPGAAGTTGTTGPTGGFKAAMADALQSVSQQQLQAQQLQRELTLDNPAVSVEQTVMAMQKAQLGFQATLQVRNRLLSAYTDIMNMQV